MLVMPAAPDGWSCTNCSHEGERVHWFCPSCGSFDSYQALQTQGEVD
jgi:lipopolysaccharide biosynthesis regulator YciM